MNTKPLPLPDVASLPNDVPTLQSMIGELIDTVTKLRREVENSQQRLDLLLRKLYGQKSERYDPNQPMLFPEMEPGAEAKEVIEAAPESPKNEAKPKRKGHGRKKLPENLPRNRIEHTLAEAERMCPCCKIPCEKFGEDVHEQLDYKPASLIVNQYVRFKYACKKCHDHITVSHCPISIIDGGIPGAGLLAQIVASKYADHLPLNRLERILSRNGIDLSRSTMCDWMAHVAGMVRPVVDMMASIARESRVLHTDATSMPFLDPKMPGKTRSGQMWVYVGDRDHPFDLFGFCRDHSSTSIDTFIRDTRYRGYLNADAHNIYDHLFANGDVIEIGCWAHARRYFHDAKNADPTRAHFAMGVIRQLYSIESEASDCIKEQNLSFLEADAIRQRLRQEKSLPILLKLHSWLLEEHPKLLPKSLIAQAVNYVLRHWHALMRYIEDGFFAIDNNIAERTLRHIALGRKNWLFAGSATGGETAATLFSIVSSCHRHRVDVFAYLRDLLERLAAGSRPTRYDLPDRWPTPTAP